MVSCGLVRRWSIRSVIRICGTARLQECDCILVVAACIGIFGKIAYARSYCVDFVTAPLEQMSEPGLSGRYCVAEEALWIILTVEAQGYVPLQGDRGTGHWPSHKKTRSELILDWRTT